MNLNTSSLPLYAVVALTVVFNGLYAALKVFQTGIDVQTYVLLNGILAYAAGQLHVNILNQQVAAARMSNHS